MRVAKVEIKAWQLTAMGWQVDFLSSEQNLRDRHDGSCISLILFTMFLTLYMTKNEWVAPAVQPHRVDVL